MTEEETENKINSLKEKLQDFEDVDPAYMNEEMKELRHFTLYVHLRIEDSLGSLIALNQIEPLAKYNIPQKDLLSVMVGGTVALLEVDFYRKIEICSSWKILTPKQRTTLEKVNNLRKYFSHVGKYQQKLDELKNNRDKYLEAVETLVLAMNIINTTFAKQKYSK